MSIPTLAGLHLAHQGKVRDTYYLDRGFLLIVATNAISIFNFVLDATVPRKGVMLNVMAHFFLTKLQSEGFKTHLVAAGVAIDRYLPEHLRGDPWLQSCAMVVQRLNMLPVEFVHRTHYVKSSSSFNKYDTTSGGSICGHELPPGLQDGDELGDIIDTPTHKSEDDEPIHYRVVRNKYPRAAAYSMDAFACTDEYLRARGIRRPDGKCEMGINMNGDLCFGDEYGTPDCSRYWLDSEWQKTRDLTPRVAPPPHDKQFMREEGIRLGINRLNPKNEDDVTRVHAMRISDGILEKTSEIYADVCCIVLSRPYEHYLEHELGVELR